MCHSSGPFSSFYNRKSASGIPWLVRTPPELNADIIERGLVMTGGGSMLKGLQKLISRETGVPVILVEKPLECVAVGAGQAFELFKDMSSSRSVYDNLNN